MFSEISLIAVCVGIPFFCLFSFREGLKYGQAKNAESPLKEVEGPFRAVRRNLKEHKEKKRVHALNEETRKRQSELNQVLKNLYNYKGSNEGQVKIK